MRRDLTVDQLALAFGQTNQETMMRGVVLDFHPPLFCLKEVTAANRRVLHKLAVRPEPVEACPEQGRRGRRTTDSDPRVRSWFDEPVLSLPKGSPRTDLCGGPLS